MRSKKEIIKAFKQCWDDSTPYCEGCPYEGVDRCLRIVSEDIIKLLENEENAAFHIERGIENALSLLDIIYTSGRMEHYSDYSALHDAIDLIGFKDNQDE